MSKLFALFYVLITPVLCALIQPAVAQQSMDHNLEINFDIYDYEGGFSSDFAVDIYVNGVLLKGEFLPNDSVYLNVLPGRYEIVAIIPEQYAGIEEVVISGHDSVLQTVELKSGLLGKALDYKAVRLDTPADSTVPVSFGFQSSTGYEFSIEDVGSIMVEPIKSGSFIEHFGGFPNGRTEILTEQFILTDNHIDTVSSKDQFDIFLASMFDATEFTIEISVLNPTYGARLFGRFHYKIESVQD